MCESVPAYASTRSQPGSKKSNDVTNWGTWWGTRAAGHHITLRTRVQGVGGAAADQPIPPAPTTQRVLPVGAGEAIVTPAAREVLYAGDEIALTGPPVRSAAVEVDPHTDRPQPVAQAVVRSRPAVEHVGARTCVTRGPIEVTVDQVVVAPGPVERSRPPPPSKRPCSPAPCETSSAGPPWSLCSPVLAATSTSSPPPPKIRPALLVNPWSRSSPAPPSARTLPPGSGSSRPASSPMPSWSSPSPSSTRALDRTGSLMALACALHLTVCASTGVQPGPGVNTAPESMTVQS